MNQSTLTLNIDLNDEKQTQALANFFATLASGRPTIHTIEGRIEKRVASEPQPVIIPRPEELPGTFTVAPTDGLTEEVKTEEVKTEEPEKPKRSRAKKQVEAPVPTEDKVAPEEPDTEALEEPEEVKTESAEPSVISIEYVREKLAECIRGNVNNRITVKNELQETFGAENVTSLPQEKYGEFLEYLKTL